ncbi:MAG: hypothetical protein OXC91_04125 [Rhodobacteraceae bacterium]|nr:hypothetical protein [Paracoccaceae bacterium]
MRIYFRKIERAKKSAKALAASVDGLKFSAARETLSALTGYRDWHELEKTIGRDSVEMHSISGQEDQPRPDVVSLTLKLSDLLGLSFGDGLYALAEMRLPGIGIGNLEAYEAMWLRLFKKTQPLWDGERSSGTVVRVNSPGWEGVGAIAILKKYGRPTDLITHQAPNSMVADFEVVFPRSPLSLFVPARLKLPYGVWTEEDGSKVLFSRDYKPLWRLTDGKKAERLQPWLWIKSIDRQYFWDDRNRPWGSVRRLEEEENWLHGFGIHCLPKLVDTLPDLIFDSNLRTVGDAVERLAERERVAAI